MPSLKTTESRNSYKGIRKLSKKTSKKGSKTSKYYSEARSAAKAADKKATQKTWSDNLEKTINRNNQWTTVK